MRYQVSSVREPDDSLSWLVHEVGYRKEPHLLQKFTGPSAEQDAFDLAMILREEYEQDLYSNFG